VLFPGNKHVNVRRLSLVVFSFSFFVLI